MRILLTLLLAAGVVAAQGMDPKQIEKQMEDIAQLMRESEKLLYGITQVDRLVAQQEEIVRKLEELEPPPSSATPEAVKQHAQQREKLENQQREAARKLEEMLENQKQQGEAAVQRLMELLQKLPRGGGGGGGKDRSQQQSQSERQRQMRNQQEEKKQRERNRQKEDREQRMRDRQDPSRPESKTDDPATIDKRVQAWITSLPPQMQERINKGNFSDVPLRYRKIVEEYTARRAKRESEPKEDE